MHTFAQEAKASQPATANKPAVLIQAQETESGWSELGSSCFGRDFRRIPLRPPSAGVMQTKLVVNEPGDRYEQEADRLAEQVMHTPDGQACSCGGSCPNCQAEQPGGESQSLPASGLQTSRVRASDTGQATAPPIVHEVLRSPGQPLDAATRAFMEPRFGYDFSRVQVHSGTAAARSARSVSAHAYTVGRDIVFGAGRYAPDTNEGRQLIAHELTHVVQQSGAGRSGAGPGHESAPVQHPPLFVVQRQPYYEKSESEVVEAVIEALQQSNNIAGLNVDPAFEILNQHPLPFQTRVLAELYDRSYFHGLLGYLAPGTKANHPLIVAIRFVECQKDPSLLTYEEILEAGQFLKYDVTLPPELKPMFACLEKEREKRHFAKVFEPGSEACSLKKGTMQWRLFPAQKIDKSSNKQRMQIKFTPAAAYRDKTVTFLQTLREEGGNDKPAVIDIGVNQAAFRPFYGVNWDQPAKKWVPSNEGQDVGFRSQPSTAEEPAAYLFDEPYFFPKPHGRVFESVAVVPETGETLGALTWGVGAVPDYAQNPKCADKPSSGFKGAVEKFHTPKSPATGQGQENYDAVFDGFAPNDAALTDAQKKELDALVTRAKEMIANNKDNPDAIKKHLVVGGFGDAADKDAMAASEQRAQAVANYLTGKGIPNDVLSVRTFGATWARYEVSTKKAQEGRNRRVQIRLFLP